MTRKILNVRLVIGLIVGLVLLSGGVHVLHGTQVKKSAVSLRDRADKAEKEGRADRAEEYLSRYLLYRPADVDALVRYGDMIAKAESTEASRQKVRSLFDKAMRLAPERSDVRRRLIDFDLAAGDYSNAKVQVEALLSGAARDGELKLLLGRCEEGTGRFREASDRYAEAVKLDPTLVSAYTRRADVLRRRLSDPTLADAVMDAKGAKSGLIAANPKSFAAYLARASYRETYLVPGVDSASDVAKALELAPDEADVRLAAARVALSKGRIDEAREHLIYAVKRHAEVTVLYQVLSELEASAGHMDEAAEWLRKGVSSVALKSGNEGVMLNWLLADLLIRNGKTNEAEEVVATLKKEQVRAELLEYLEAASLAAQGRNALAAKRFAAIAPVLESVPDFKSLAKRAWIALARCYERLGNVDQRLDAYRRAVAIELDPDPLRLTARFGLAAALVSMDKLDEALDEYRRIPNDANAGLAIARLQILQNFRRPDDQRRWEVIGQTLDAVEKGLSGTADAGRAGSEIAILRAEALAVQGHLDQARSLLDKAIAKTPDQVDLWVALANLVGRGARPEEMLSVLDDAQKRLGDRVEFRQARAAYWGRKGGDEAPAALAKLQQGTEKLDTEGLTALRRDLAAAYARIGKQAEAESLWKQLAEMQPDDLNARLTLFDLALRSKNRAAASESLDQIRRIEGEDGSFWRFARALLLLDGMEASPRDRSSLVEARTELEKVGSLRPSWSRVPIVLAQVDLLDGRPDAAIRQYMRAIVQMGDRNPTAIRRVAQLLSERQRFSEAEIVLKKLREDRAPLSGEMQKLAAQVAFRNEDYSGALEKAQGVVSDNSENYRDLIWLAQLRWSAGQPAEPTLRRAVALAKDAPEARIALIAYLAGTGKKVEAEAALKSAEQELPREKSLLALAQGHELLGQKEKAESLYDEFLAAHPNDLGGLRASASFHLRTGGTERAEAQLRKVIDLGGAMIDASWARRVLAAVLVSRGGHSRNLQALEILGLTDQPGTAEVVRDEDRSAEDLRARARILALQPSRVRRDEATAILVRLIDRGLAQPDDSFLLAQLYEAANDWPKARTQWQKLVQSRNDKPVYLAAYLRSLLRHNQLDEAKLMLDRIEAIAPGQPILVEAKARFLKAANQGEKAAVLIADFAQKADALLEPGGRLCEELDQHAAAERLLRLAVEKNGVRRPATTLVLAGFLGRRGRLEEALDLIDKHAWAALPASQVSAAVLTILYGAGTSPAELRERFAKRLEAAIEKDPKALTLRFDLANLRSIEGRYKEAEAIFRDIADRNKSLGSPLNNLAWIIVLQPGDRAAEALKLVDRAIELEGETPNLLDTRAMAQLALNRPDPAVRDLEDAIAVSPTPEKYFHLARCYLASGRRGDAERALREADTRGLKVPSLHPLEQEAYRRLVGELAKR